MQGEALSRNGHVRDKGGAVNNARNNHEKGNAPEHGFDQGWPEQPPDPLQSDPLQGGVAVRLLLLPGLRYPKQGILPPAGV
ncbi:hypothetical protein D3C76_1603460 [compost metagenome]